MDSYIIFLDCDCQTLNVVVYNDVLTYQSKHKGIYQRIVDVNGQTAWNSSNTKAIWWVPSSDDWMFGPMEKLGENYGSIMTTGAGNLSCLYNLQDPGDQWVYYNDGAWTLANVGDVSIQCLSGNVCYEKFDTHLLLCTVANVYQIFRNRRYLDWV